MNICLGVPSENPTGAILALDPERIPIRYVRASFDGHCAYVEEHGNFSSISEVEEYFTRWTRSTEVHLAASSDTLDPLNVLPWLEENGYTVELFPLANRLSSRAHELAPWKLPDTHHDAYVVATLVACKNNVPEAAESILFQLFHLNEDLNEVQNNIRVLIATVTERELTGQTPPSIPYRPF